ncbi:MAG: SURF1 family protein, partial [Acidimicrobiia bacterium]|nr:SURF1 family protein [Acidimicrobiia bacterium]
MLALVLVLLNLGFWQLRRLEERRLDNQVGMARNAAEPLELESMVAGAGSEID